LGTQNTDHICQTYEQGVPYNDCSYVISDYLDSGSKKIEIGMYVIGAFFIICGLSCCCYIHSHKEDEEYEEHE